jgi:hypothetical protein
VSSLIARALVERLGLEAEAIEPEGVATARFARPRNHAAHFVAETKKHDRRSVDG